MSVEIEENWKASVKIADDTVLIPGDVSWAMTLNEAVDDMIWLNALPGQKILLRGNHDYWWQSLAKLDAFRSEYDLHSLSFLRNNAFRVAIGSDGKSETERYAIVCGTRGWLMPDDPQAGADDQRIFERECIRLDLSLAAAASIRQPGDALVCMLHYPPYALRPQKTRLTEQMTKAAVDICVYGHVHDAKSQLNVNNYEIGSVRYSICAADQLRFRPLRLL